MKIEFYGNKGDVFQCNEITTGNGIEGHWVSPDDLDSCYSFEIKDPDGNGLMVVGTYGLAAVNGPLWTIGIAQLEEDLAIPSDWDLRIDTADNGYSTRLTMDVPKGTVITGDSVWVVGQS